MTVEILAAIAAIAALVMLAAGDDEKPVSP